MFMLTQIYVPKLVPIFNGNWITWEHYSTWLTTLPNDGHLTWMSAIFLWYVKLAFNI